MIYYFSGTGNSKTIALRLATMCQEKTACITTIRNNYREDKVLGFVFPVYAWGLPKVMRQFIQQLKRHQLPLYTFMVCTCGDDIGYTEKEIRLLLSQKGILLNAAWSIRMPNTYVVLPGFDIDTPSLTQKKLTHAWAKIEEIAHQINRRNKDVIDIHPGPFPFIKSRVLRPLFNRFLTGDNKFRSNDSCIHCGICTTVCPMENIHLNDNGNPVWNGNCTNCMACYHNCPQHAIDFGPFTKNKGQYLINKYYKKK